ncbi:MAG: sulfatase [Anaerolineae bacterium]|nr:sulfatase [Anaerolineae bacterium]
MAVKGGHPNVVFVFADQMRAQATGYAGDPNARTPNLDRLAGECVNLVNAISGHPVCSPYRASLLTGQYPLTHGVYINDVHLDDDAVSIAKVFGAAGYDTGYVGKWHLNGSPDGAYGGRHAFIPPESHQGFAYWKAFECNHNYMVSPYFEGDDPEPKLWEAYDPIAQTRDACRYIQSHANGERPFFLMLSYGTPHDPYDLVPEEYRAMFADREIRLRPNVLESKREDAIRDLRGYYAHIAAIDDCVGALLDALEGSSLAEDTIFIFTSDHGDCHYSHGMWTKVVPFEESIRVPFLLRYPAMFGAEGQQSEVLLDAPDIMPTLLRLCGFEVPDTVEGRDFSPVLLGEAHLDASHSAFLSAPVSFAILRAQGLPAYRGVRTLGYTYVRSIRGPWMLFDNVEDPYQLHNRCNDPAYAAVQLALEAELQSWLDRLGDAFLPGHVYLERDGLTHYREVTGEWGRLRTPWTVPESGGTT